jgi:endonuclease/exonuclease/phosphatase family metal-dependent hydrolase
LQVFALVATIYINQIDFPVEVSAYPLYAPEVPVWSLILLLVTLVLLTIVLVDFMLFYRELVAIKPSYPQLGGGFASAGFFAMLMVLSHVFTTVYDYIPVVGPFFRDKFWFVYLVVGVVMIMALFLVRTATHERTAMSEDDKLPYGSFILVAIFAFITITAAILFDPQPGNVAKETNSLKILTYNIQQGYSDGGLKNYDGQLDLIREIDADIIGLQESDTNRIANGNADVVRYFAERLNMYTYFGPKTVTGTFGDALLSKYPIENPRTFYMYSKGEQTATIEAQITVEGEMFNVYVTHLGNGGPMVQQQQVLEVLDGKENVILIGDFNFRPYEEQYAITTEILVDAWIVRWPGGDLNQGIDPMERIDHTFLTPGMTVIDSEYIPDPASDHPAMWTVISW